MSKVLYLHNGDMKENKKIRKAKEIVMLCKKYNHTNIPNFITDLAGYSGKEDI